MRRYSVILYPDIANRWAVYDHQKLKVVERFSRRRDARRQVRAMNLGLAEY
jgi:hypothetical protein